MDCAHAREVLWPPERPRLAGRDVVAAQAHVAACDACGAWFTGDRALEPFRAAVEVAPDGALRERVFDALAARRAGATLRPSPHRPRRGSAALVAAAIAVAALAGTALWSVTSARPSVEAAAFVDDYVRRAVSADRIESSDAAEVGRFLTRELGTPLRPLRGRELALLGAEICLIEGRRGAMVRYRKDGRTVITHYVMPDDGERSDAPAHAHGATADEGVAVVTWTTGAFRHALVADVPADSLIALAWRSRAR